MIELSFIIIQVLIFFIFFWINPLTQNINAANQDLFSLSENISFNFIIHSNFILVLSILNLNLKEMITVYLLSILITYLFFFKNNFLRIKALKKIYIFEFIILFVISSIIFIDISNKLIVSWDAEKFWLSKTLNFYNEFSIDNLKNVARPHYPFLGNLLNSFYWKLSFINYEYSGRLVFGFIYCLALFLLINNLILSKFFKLIFLMLLLLITYDYPLILSGNQEIFIFSIICIVMNSFYKIKINKKNILTHLIIIFLSCNLLIWIKQEGIFYSFFLICTLFFILKLNFKQKFFYILAIIIFLSIKLFVFKFYNLEISLNKSVISSLAPYDLLMKINLDRIFLLLKYIFFAPFQSYFLLCGIVFYILNRIFKTKIEYLNFYILINFLFIFIVYLFIDNQEFNLKTGIDRLIFNISPFIIILLVEVVNNKKKN
jgi:hypothetical protein